MSFFHNFLSSEHTNVPYTVFLSLTLSLLPLSLSLSLSLSFRAGPVFLLTSRGCRFLRPLMQA